MVFMTSPYNRVILFSVILEFFYLNRNFCYVEIFGWLQCKFMSACHPFLKVLYPCTFEFFWRFEFEFFWIIFIIFIYGWICIRVKILRYYSKFQILRRDYSLSLHLLLNYLYYFYVRMNMHKSYNSKKRLFQFF